MTARGAAQNLLRLDESTAHEAGLFYWRIDR